MRVTAVLLHCCFPSREEFQISCSCSYTRVSLGCQNILILDGSSRRRCKLPFLCRLVNLFLRGVAKQKKLQDEGFICSGVSLGSIGYASGWEITIKHRWIICWVIYKELMYSSRMDLLFELLSIGSLIFNTPRISWHGWRRKEILDTTVDSMETQNISRFHQVSKWVLL